MPKGVIEKSQLSGWTMSVGKGTVKWERRTGGGGGGGKANFCF